jgi:hypothetical protein
MAHVDHLNQSGTQKIVLVQGRLSRLHITAQNCKVPTETIPNLALITQRNQAVYQQNQRPIGCSGRTTYLLRFYGAALIAQRSLAIA